MISDYLSKEERFGCIKAGALMVAGGLDATEGPLPQVKEAQILSGLKNTLEAGNSLALFLSLSAGLPLGVFLHGMDRRIRGKRLKEEELKEKIKLYRGAADEMASGLGEGGY